MGDDMSSKNLELWESVRKVDQSKIKDANIGGHKCKSVNAIEMTRMLTKAIGPIGSSWKYRVLWERFDNERPLTNPSTGEIITDGNGAAVWEQSHTAMIEFSIRGDDGEWCSFEHMGHTPYRYGSGGTTYNGQTKPFKIVVDKEYGKKTITDGVKKCMSYLGVAADVYSGDLDNWEYAAQAQDAIEIEKADDSAQKLQDQVEEIGRRLKDSQNFIEKASDYAQARRSLKNHITYIGNRAASGNQKLQKPAAKALLIIEQALSEKQKIEQKIEAENVQSN
jgi:hypothetical protein